MNANRAIIGMVLLMLGAWVIGQMSFSPAEADPQVLSSGYSSQAPSSGSLSQPAQAPSSGPQVSGQQQPAQEGQPVPDGTTLKAGDLVVTEMDNWQSKQGVVFGGVLSQDFVVCDRCTPQTSAWKPYASVQRAQEDACKQANARRGDPQFAGWTFTVTSQCGQAASLPAQQPAPQAPAQQPAPQQAPAPSVQKGVAPAGCVNGAGVIFGSLPVGFGAVVRDVHWDTGEVFIDVVDGLATALPLGPAFDGNGMHERTAWYLCNGVAWSWIWTDACKEAHESWTLLAPRPRQVFLHGVPVGQNEACPAFKMPSPGTPPVLGK